MKRNASDLSAKKPLCVDLDGALIRTDLTFESLLAALKQQPWLLFLLPWWLLAGRSYLKHQLVHRAHVDVSLLPYRATVIDLIQSAKLTHRPVVLVTGSHEILARQVAEHLPVFDSVLATTRDQNLDGRSKADLLERDWGARQFEYVASGWSALPVWRKSCAAVSVNAPTLLVRQVAGIGIPHRDISDTESKWRTWARAIRLQQWLKNLLLFVPIITAHELLNGQALLAAALAFLSFGACASATYIINDLLDLDADRHHHKKRLRPFAAGTIDVRAGLVALLLLLSAGLCVAWFLPVGFQFMLVAYLVTTLLYSLWLKRVASLDVIVLAGLYTLRIVAGALATGISLSFWLLAFSMFIFLSLALVKRVAELVEVRRKEAATGASLGKLRGREYATEDVIVLQSLGAASGYLSVLVLALYIHSPEVSELYRSPEILWLIAPLMLLWVTRLWVVTSRGYMDEDPIFFAVKDPETWATSLAIAGILFAATTLSL
ncbi:UbiA family prenyltransferase [Hydrogenophaga sp.]|uniref:UbiA family prenyltransferase n=1 Tax=Hydrogenophaga sp. TaxID=1904254 RepID=UPI003D0B9634